MPSGIPAGRNDALSPAPSKSQNTSGCRIAPVTRLRWRTKRAISRHHSVPACSAIDPIASSLLCRRLRIDYEAMAGEMDEYVLEGRLAERQRIDLVAKPVYKVADDFMRPRTLDSQGSIDDLAPELQPLRQLAREKVRRRGVDHQHVAADARLELARRRHRHHPPAIKDSNPVASLGFFQVMRG